MGLSRPAGVTYHIVTYSVSVVTEYRTGTPHRIRTYIWYQYDVQTARTEQHQPDHTESQRSSSAVSLVFFTLAKKYVPGETPIHLILCSIPVLYLVLCSSVGWGWLYRGLVCVRVLFLLFHKRHPVSVLILHPIILLPGMRYRPCGLLLVRDRACTAAGQVGQGLSSNTLRKVKVDQTGEKKRPTKTKTKNLQASTTRSKDTMVYTCTRIKCCYL